MSVIKSENATQGKIQCCMGIKVSTGVEGTYTRILGVSQFSMPVLVPILTFAHRQYHLQTYECFTKIFKTMT